MKKRLLYTAIICLAALAISCGSCGTKSSNGSEWTHQQRKEMRRTLHQYRDMVYIDEMSDAEFLIFTNNVTDEIEYAYPLYTEVENLPAVSDTIDMYITTTIVEELDADGANMKHIYPYRELKKSGVLPAGLSPKERRSFYKCLARKVDAKYDTFDQFFQAVMDNTTDKSAIAMMEAECALSLFNYTPTKEN